MQTVKQSPSEDLWLAPSSQVYRTIQFIEPTVTANDFEALQPVSGQDGLRRAIQKAASWLIVETCSASRRTARLRMHALGLEPLRP
jgi:hypothetical protein